MEDEQTVQQPQPYPHFPTTSEGLAVLYREYGRLQHMAIEQELLIGKLTAQGQKILETAEALREQHEPGKCRPVEDAVDIEPVPDAPLTVIDGTGRRARG